MTLEELLNKLIEKGWKPFGILWNVRNSVYTNKYFFFEWCADGVTLRQIASIDSWLWQFVCENEMVFVPKWEIPYVERNYIFDYECYEVSEFQYWLMVWALLKEDELEQFLLDNIEI